MDKRTKDCRVKPSRFYPSEEAAEVSKTAFA
jgi:hypothetical protein